MHLIKVYQRLSKINRSMSNAVTPWLNGFVRDQGHERAQFYLNGVGILEPKSEHLLQ